MTCAVVVVVVVAMYIVCIDCFRDYSYSLLPPLFLATFVVVVAIETILNINLLEYDEICKKKLNGEEFENWFSIR